MLIQLDCFFPLKQHPLLVLYATRVQHMFILTTSINCHWTVVFAHTLFWRDLPMHFYIQYICTFLAHFPGLSSSLCSFQSVSGCIRTVLKPNSLILFLLSESRVNAWTREWMCFVWVTHLVGWSAQSLLETRFLVYLALNKHNNKYSKVHTIKTLCCFLQS